MTVEQGFGMLGMGLIAITVAGTIMYLVINKIKGKELEDKEREKREKIFRR
jgi:hypothetical protein